MAKSLEEALRESVDILDVGRSRTPRTPLVRHGLGENMEVDPVHIPVPESDDDSLEVFYTVNDDGAWETFYAAKNRTEVSMKDLKLFKTESIKVHYGKGAEKLRATIPKERVLDSRFVKTRSECPDKRGVLEMKCRWCMKGFKDPGVHI